MCKDMAGAGMAICWSISSLDGPVHFDFDQKTQFFSRVVVVVIVQQLAGYWECLFFLIER